MPGASARWLRRRVAIDGSGNVTGFFDENDGGIVTINNSIPAGAAASAPDSFGRGIVTGATGADSAFNYYVVGPEVIRVIDVNTTSTAIGSAYGQGTSAGTFTSGSIGASVFSVANSEDLYAGVGEISSPGVTTVVKRKHSDSHSTGWSTLQRRRRRRVM